MVTRRLVMLAAGAATLWSTAFAGNVLVPGLGGGLQLEVESYQEKRFSSIMRQQYDFSCGSAAVASLLSYHYEHKVTEAEVFRGMFSLADPDKVRREGFSMLDMKRYLESEGYLADGFRLPLTGMREKVALPAIALVTLTAFGTSWSSRASVSVRSMSATQLAALESTREHNLKSFGTVLPS